MGWFKNLFGGGASEPKAVILETGDSRPDQLVCVRMDGAYLIDLRPLPPEHDRVIRAIEQVTAKIVDAPQPIQVWVASNRLLELYSGDTDALMKLTDALFQATKRVQPQMIVEADAPAGVVYILRSLGFEVFLPGL